MRCSRRDTGLSKASIFNVSQVATIDKRALLERAGALAASKPAQVEEAWLVLGL